MKKLIIILIVLFIAIASGLALATEIPKKDFIDVTEKVLDAVDGIETAISSPDSTDKMKEEAFQAFKNAEKKYDRLSGDNNKDQTDIQMQLKHAYFSFMSARYTGIGSEPYIKGKEDADKALDLFKKYKEKK